MLIKSQKNWTISKHMKWIWPWCHMYPWSRKPLYGTWKNNNVQLMSIGMSLWPFSPIVTKAKHLTAPKYEVSKFIIDNDTIAEARLKVTKKLISSEIANWSIQWSEEATVHRKKLVNLGNEGRCTYVMHLRRAIFNGLLWERERCTYVEQ